MVEHRKGPLVLRPVNGQLFQLVDQPADGPTGEGVVLSVTELRWLCQIAGPAALAEHAPLPTVRDRP